MISLNGNNGNCSRVPIKKKKKKIQLFKSSSFLNQIRTHVAYLFLFLSNGLIYLTKIHLEFLTEPIPEPRPSFIHFSILDVLFLFDIKTPL